MTETIATSNLRMVNLTIYNVYNIGVDNTNSTEPDIPTLTATDR